MNEKLGDGDYVFDLLRNLYPLYIKRFLTYFNDTLGGAFFYV
ncbi:hypothetical protein BAOM_4472 [Peribacillus asahii]|uniref:Uncharacterized protein n=1 Tax=Peribacillus asahii TaxID=228899 RepID=A0A3T0KXJ6_9BACI|nr:hypothetical protein BAOM_4472 [Peribacillus asahii]